METKKKMIKNGLEYKECPGCKRICLKPEMTSGGICKDCLIERLEEENKYLQSIVDRARDEKLIDF